MRAKDLLPLQRYGRRLWMRLNSWGKQNDFGSVARGKMARLDLAPVNQHSRRRCPGGREPQGGGIEFEQARRLRGRVTKLEAEFDGVELGRRPCEQDVAVAYGVQGAGPPESAADFVATDGFAHVVDYDQCCSRSIAQAQQALAQSGHGAGVVFILIVGGIQRVQDNDLCGGRLRGGEEVLQPLRCTEQKTAMERPTFAVATTMECGVLSAQVLPSPQSSTARIGAAVAKPCP